MGKRENITIFAFFIVLLILKAFSVVLFIHFKHKQTVQTNMLVAQN